MSKDMMTKELWVRLETGYRDWINLQYMASGRNTDEFNQQIRRLFVTYADPKGVFTYVDLFKSVSMNAIRARDVKDMKVEVLTPDKDCPIEGLLVFGNFHTKLWGANVGHQSFE